MQVQPVNHTAKFFAQHILDGQKSVSRYCPLNAEVFMSINFVSIIINYITYDDDDVDDADDDHDDDDDYFIVVAVVVIT